MISKLRQVESLLLDDLTTYTRYLYNEIDFSQRLIGIFGSRGVGKTTLCLQYLKNLKDLHPNDKSLYVSLDSPFASDIDLFEFALDFSSKGGKYLLLDEVHKHKDFAVHIKAIYDNIKNLHIIFTGSNVASIVISKADLSRRATTYHMKGLSFREFIELKTNLSLPKYTLSQLLENNLSIQNDIKHKFLPLEFWDEYLSYGYYPFYLEKKTDTLNRLLEVVNTTIEVDLVNIGLISAEFVHKIKKLLLVICQSDPSPINISKIATVLEVHRNTVYNYFQALQSGSLMHIVNNYSKGYTKLVKPDKVYFDNTNLLHTFCTNPKTGTIRETFFVTQMKDLDLFLSKQGDFFVDYKYTIEVGGKNKSFNQIKELENSYLALDTDFTTHNNKIPLWLFGFLY
jgi:predicted AAA+ superfamily ATPase